MNYLINEMYHHTFPISHSGSLGVLEPRLNVLFNDGSTIVESLSQNRYSNLFNFRLKNIIKHAKQEKKFPIGVAVCSGNGSELDLFIPSSFDYVDIYNQNESAGLTFEVTARNMNMETGISSSADDYLGIGLIDINQYFNFNEDYTYTQYETDLDGYGNCIYDFTNIYEDTLWYDNDGNGLHTHFLRLNTGSYLTIGVGNPYVSIRDTAYEGGYSNGYNDGTTAGYDRGYNDGVNSLPPEQQLDAFGYIGQAFNAVSNVLSIEVLPHVTLGLCFSIPLVLTLCMTLFKLIKK